MQISERIAIAKDDMRYWWAGGFAWRLVSIGLLLYLLLVVALAFYWSREPAQFSVFEAGQRYSGQSQPASGAVTTGTMIEVATTLLDKPGGFLSNDISPPGVVLDNICLLYTSPSPRDS